MAQQGVVCAPDKEDALELPSHIWRQGANRGFNEQKKPRGKARIGHRSRTTISGFCGKNKAAPREDQRRLMIPARTVAEASIAQRPRGSVVAHAQLP